jgi:TRAP-type C4-dicarboxylate transport system permease small subunit
MKQTLARIADVLGTVERYGAAVLTVVMTLLYGLNVAVRFLAPSQASALAWVDEASRYILVWIVFLAIGITLEVGRHVSVDLIRGRIAARAEHVLFKVIDVVGLVFSLAAMAISISLALFVQGTGQTSPTLGVPTFILYVAPAFGFASLSFRFLLRLLSIRDARRQPVDAPWLGGSPT